MSTLHYKYVYGAQCTLLFLNVKHSETFDYATMDVIKIYKSLSYMSSSVISIPS